LASDSTCQLKWVGMNEVRVAAVNRWNLVLCFERQREEKPPIYVDERQANKEDSTWGSNYSRCAKWSHEWLADRKAETRTQLLPSIRWGEKGLENGTASLETRASGTRPSFCTAAYVLSVVQSKQLPEDDSRTRTVGFGISSCSRWLLFWTTRETYPFPFRASHLHARHDLTSIIGIHDAAVKRWPHSPCSMLTRGLGRACVQAVERRDYVLCWCCTGEVV